MASPPGDGFRKNPVNHPSRRLPGLYIHVPFCASRCRYCSFFSSTDRSRLPSYLDSLRREMALAGDDFEAFDTFYLGGGTPSVLPRRELEGMIEGSWKAFSITGDCEATIEANPGDVDRDFCSFLRDTPLNRINLGVQSFDDDILRYLGRRHHSREARAALDATRAAGFSNIGIDLIYGVPGQSLESWMDTLERAIIAEPEHLSCYELTPEPGTPIGDRCASGEDRLPDEDLRYRFFMATSEYLETSGYIHYEVSNFARGNAFRSRHNMKYWNHTPYLGLGPSAHSFSGNRRWWNHRSLDRYCADLADNRRPLEDSERLSPDDVRLETLFLGLRTREGVSLDEVDGWSGDTGREPGKRILEQCLAGGLLEISNGRIRPTRRGLALADQLALLP